MKSVTIQINSRDALERLIGGDSQLEIDIRNNIVQKFAEKHLKPLANQWNEQLLNCYKDEARKIFEQTLVDSTKGAYWHSGSSYTVKPEIKKAILEIAEQYVQNQLAKIRGELNEKFNEQVQQVRVKSAEFMKEHLEQVITHEFNTRVNAEVERRLAEIKSKL